MAPTLDLDKAYVTVQFYGEAYEIRNLWETLEHMKQNWSQLDSQEREAYKMLSDDVYIGLINSRARSVTIDEDDGYTD